MLGFSDEEINRVLDYRYPALANEIQQPNKHSNSYAENIHLYLSRLFLRLRFSRRIRFLFDLPLISTHPLQPL